MAEKAEVEHAEPVAQIISAIADLLWPVMALIVSIALLVIVWRILKRSTTVDVEVGDIKFSMSADTKSTFVDPIIDEANNTLHSMDSRDSAFFAAIYRRLGGGTPYQLSPSFERQSRLHLALRRLRNFNLIRPIGGSSWQSRKYVEITRFGYLFVKLKALELGLKRGSNK